MSACVFCEIASGEATAHRILEDDRTLAFLDAAPAAPGHVLVVPTVHRETLTDAEPDLVADVFRTVRRAASAVESAFDPDGLTVVQSNGTAAGQEIPHAHVHVVPRYEDDDVIVRWPHDELPDDAGRDVADAIRAEL